jgi:hypothetical protein
MRYSSRGLQEEEEEEEEAALTTEMNLYLHHLMLSPTRAQKTSIGC